MIKLVGSITVNGKKYDLKDSIGSVTPESLGLPDNWYGGMIKRMYKTKDGYYICADKKDNLINLAYFEKDIKQVENVQEETKEPDEEEKTKDGLSRKELIAKAKELGIKGKLATMKTEEILEEISKVQE